MTKFLLALALFTGFAGAQGLRFEGHVTTSATNVPPGAQAPVLTVPTAQITVCGEPANPYGDVCTNIVPVYADQALTQVLSQPLQADEHGRFVFWDSAGSYDYSVQTPLGTYVGTYAANIPYTGTLATDAHPGLVQLALGQTSATLAKVATTGDYGDLLNAPTIPVSNFPGADACAQLAAADAAYLGQSVTFSLGGSCASAAVLSAYHGLLLSTPLTFTGAGTITPTSHNTARCIGAGAFINNRAGGDPSVDSLFTAGAGVSMVNWLDISGCRVEGIGINANSFLFYSFGPSTHIHLQNNTVHNAQLMEQQSAAPNTSDDLLVTGNSVVWDQPGGYAANVLIYGAFLNVNVSGNNFAGGGSGGQFYCRDGSYFPPLADIVNCGLRNLIFNNNTCEAMGETCGWGSMMYRAKFDANTVTGCGDVCIDFEASADTTGSNNTVTGGANGDLTEYYVGYDNAFVGNTIVSAGENGISIRNANFNNPANQTNLRAIGNTFTCPIAGANVACTFLYTEASQGVVFESNHITNGTFAYSKAFFSRPIFTNNTILWTVPVISNNSGGVTNGGAALSVPDFNDQSGGIVSGNVISSTVAQQFPCMSAGMSAAANELVIFTGNVCSGWTLDAGLTNSNGNAGVPQTFVFHGNQFSTGTITTGGNAPVTVIRGGNYAGTNPTAN